MLLTSKRAIRLCIFALLIIGLLSHLIASGAAKSMFDSNSAGLANRENLASEK